MRSTRYAALLASGYTLLAAAYIVISSRIAAHLSADVAQLERIETFKGVLYVVVTAIAIFLGARFAFARLEHAHAHISARDQLLIESERRVFAGLLAGSIAHDANNVLVAVLADLDALEQAMPPGDPTLGRLQQSVGRLVALNRRLLVAARRGGLPRAEDVDLAQAVRETLSVLRAHPSLQRREVRFASDRPLAIHTHGLLVQQALANLVVNAAEAGAGRGQVEVRLLDAPGGAILEVHDDGPGIPAERRERIFEALETTKPGGSGLGLFSVRACVTALRGRVEVDDSPLGGACFRIHLPELPREAPAAQAAAGSPPAGASAR